MKVLFAEQVINKSKNGFYFTEKSHDELGAMLDTGAGSCIIESALPGVSFVANSLCDFENGHAPNAAAMLLTADAEDIYSDIAFVSADGEELDEKSLTNLLSTLNISKNNIATI